jgi:hypothetical protein
MLAANTPASASWGSRAHSRNNKQGGGGRLAAPEKSRAHGRPARWASGEDDCAASGRAVVPGRRRGPSRVCGNLSWFGAHWRNGRRSSDHRCRRAGSFAQRSLSLDAFAFRPGPGSFRNVLRDEARSRRRRREGAETADRRLESHLTKAPERRRFPQRFFEEGRRPFLDTSISIDRRRNSHRERALAQADDRHPLDRDTTRSHNRFRAPVPHKPSKVCDRVHNIRPDRNRAQTSGTRRRVRGIGQGRIRWRLERPSATRQRRAQSAWPEAARISPPRSRRRGQA